MITAAPNVADAKKLRMETECTDPPEIGTIRWSEIGLRGPADLIRQQMLVSTDGEHWDTAAAPTTDFVRDLVGDDNGFLLLAETDRSAFVTAGGRSRCPRDQAAAFDRRSELDQRRGADRPERAGDRR